MIHLPNKSFEPLSLTLILLEGFILMGHASPMAVQEDYAAVGDGPGLIYTSYLRDREPQIFVEAAEVFRSRISRLPLSSSSHQDPSL